MFAHIAGRRGRGQVWTLGAIVAAPYLRGPQLLEESWFPKTTLSS